MVQVNLTLMPLETRQTVDVMAETPRVDTQTSMTGHTVSEAKINICRSTGATRSNSPSLWMEWPAK